MSEQDEAETVVRGLAQKNVTLEGHDNRPNGVDDDRWKLVVEAACRYAQQNVPTAIKIRSVLYDDSYVRPWHCNSPRYAVFYVVTRPYLPGFDEGTTEDQIMVCAKCGFIKMVNRG